MDDELELSIEELIILCLGVKDKPMPSKLHLEMELFLLSRAAPEIEKLLKFKKKYETEHRIYNI